MEWLIIIAVGMLCGVGANQIDRAIEESKAEKKSGYEIRDIKIKECPKINGIVVCQEMKSI